jgi:2-amino-4-hydroxy-6-hydroxymethyldihydropteridine diphosphokinase
LTETVYLSLGANLGDRRAQIRGAFLWLQSRLGAARLSRLYETAPLYDTEQPPFLNAAAMTETTLSPVAVMDLIEECEGIFGRMRDPARPKGPRSIDVDLLLHGKSIVDSAKLILPHPDLEQRRFVLIPLLELCPTLASPRTGIPYWRILESLPSQGVLYHLNRAD